LEKIKRETKKSKDKKIKMGIEYMVIKRNSKISETREKSIE